MGLTARKAVESITWTAAAALFAAQLYPQNTQGYTPAFAELICWALVLGFIELSPRLRARFLGEANISFTASPSYLPWVAAVSILVTTLSSSVDSFAWITVSSSVHRLSSETVLTIINSPQLHQFSSLFAAAHGCHVSAHHVRSPSIQYGSLVA
jgi:hypothetical protein